MSNEVQNVGGGAGSEKKWHALNPTQRRVLGVLVEKAKTTPESYPMTLNGIVTGCNQKSNRHPVTNLQEDQVEEALGQLRSAGAVIEVVGGGRVPKYRHCAYEWLAVDKVEAAIMAELLLRGDQTLGDLRSRAARMEPIGDINALRPIVQGLIDRGLVMQLTSPGRGQVVSHNLYKDRELEQLREKYAGMPADLDSGDDDSGSSAGSGSSSSPSSDGATRSKRTDESELIQQLQARIEALETRLSRIETLLQ